MGVLPASLNVQRLHEVLTHLFSQPLLHDHPRKLQKS